MPTFVPNTLSRLQSLPPPLLILFLPMTPLLPPPPSSSPAHDDGESHHHHDAVGAGVDLQDELASLSPTVPARWPVRVYIRVRLRRGHQPDSEGKVSFGDLRYELAWDDGARSVAVYLPLSGIQAKNAQLLRWAQVFTYTPACAQMQIPNDKLQVIRDITALFYLFWKEEEGFTKELYDDVCAAIATYTDYQVPTPPADRTSVLKAILIYVKRRVGEERFEPTPYTTDMLAAAEEVMFEERKVNSRANWPDLSLEALRLRSEGPVQRPRSDQRHDFELNPSGNLPPMSPMFDNELRGLYLNMLEA